MARTILEHQEDKLTFPPDSILELKIDEAEVREHERRDGTGKWESLSVKFKILGIQAVGDGSNPSEYDNWITEFIWGSVPFKLTDSPNNKLRIWLEAVFRQELAIGFEFDSNMIVSRQCRGITSLYESKQTDAHGVKFMRHQVESLLPWGGNFGQPPAPPTQTWATNGQPAQDPWAAPPQQQPQYQGAPPPQYQQAPPQQQPPPQQYQAPAPQVPDPWGTWPPDEEPPF